MTWNLDFKQKQFVKVNDEIRGDYEGTKEIQMKTTMLRTSLCNFSNAYIRVSRRVTVTGLASPIMPIELLLKTVHHLENVK